MARSRTWWRAAAFVGAAALLATACGDDADTTAPPRVPGNGAADEGCTEDRVGGTVTVGTYSEATGLDPAAGSGLGTGQVGATEGSAIYDVLVVFDDQTGEYVPQLAESISANDDNTEWTLRLRPGITFDNGDPLDAEAVRISMQRHTAEGSRATLRRGLVFIDEYEVVDDLTLVFHLTQPWGDFPMMLAAAPGMITNQAVIDERGDGFNANPAGAGVGPYVLERFTPGETMVLRARDDYWGGPVCIQELRFINLAGGAFTFESLNVGQIDVAFLADRGTITRARDAGYDGLQWILGAGSMLLMNNGVGDSEPVTADVRVRRAVAAALDVDVINRRQFGGDGLPTTALVHPDSPLFPGIEGPEHDPGLAARLVQEAKDETVRDGRIRLLCNDLTDRRDAALAIESLLNAVGMRVQTTIGTTAELIAGVITNRDYDLACWAAAYTESDVWFNLSIFTSDSPTNYSGIQDEQMDAVLTQLQAAGTLDERRDALRSMQERWNEIVPSAIWGAAETYVAHTDRVHGLIPTVRQTFLFHNAYVE